MTIQSRTSTDWQFGSYEADRNQEIKRAENDFLRVNLIATGGEAVVLVPNPAGGDNITVGYGWDIDENSLADTQTNFAAAGIALTQNEETVLIGYKNGTAVTFDIGGSTVTRIPTQADFVSVWRNFTITDSQATVLLDTVIQTWEAGLTEALGDEDIPESRERAAIISLLYNTTNGTAASIEAFAPTMIGLIESNPADQEEIFIQRAGIWFEIVYGTNAPRPNDTLKIGIQNRRENEGSLFGLYTEDGTGGEREPSITEDYLESKTVIRFLDEKNANNALVNYYTARHFSENEAKMRINEQYGPAREQLLSVFYAPDLSATPDQVTVTVDAKDAGSEIAIEAFGQDVSAQKNLVLGEELNDVINGKADTDALYGGDGNDTLVGDGGGLDAADAGDDLLHGGDGIDTADYSAEDGTVNSGVTFADGGLTGQGEQIIMVTDTYGKTDTLISIEYLILNDEDDAVDLTNFTGDIGVDGGGGNDSFAGGAGNDSLFGGEGVDTLAGGAGDDLMGNIHAPTFDYLVPVPAAL